MGNILILLLTSLLWISNANADINHGLVLKYDFDEQRGPVIYDDSGYGNDAFLDSTMDYTSPRWTDIQNKKGLFFDGANDLINVGDQNSLDVDRFTIAAWVKYRDFKNAPATSEKDVTRLARRNHEVLEKIGSYWMNIRLPKEGRKLRAGGRFRGCSGYQLINVTSSKPVPPNTWTHVASTYDGSKLRVFINGKPVGSRSAKGSKCDSKHPLIIGAKYTSLPYKQWRKGVINNNFHGHIDDLVIYDRALNEKEIKELAGAVIDQSEITIEVVSRKWGNIKLAVMSTSLADGDPLDFNVCEFRSD